MKYEYKNEFIVIELMLTATEIDEFSTAFADLKADSNPYTFEKLEPLAALIDALKRKSL